MMTELSSYINLWPNLNLEPFIFSLDYVSVYLNHTDSIRCGKNLLSLNSDLFSVYEKKSMVPIFNLTEIYLKYPNLGYTSLSKAEYALYQQQRQADGEEFWAIMGLIIGAALSWYFFF